MTRPLPAPASLSGPILWRGVVDSTMDEARQQAEAGAPHGTTVVADGQRRGRGRTGAAWQSPAGAGLYATSVLHLPPTVALTSLSPLLALACAQQLRALHLPLQLKWPNDLWWRAAKVGGLLLQLLPEAGLGTRTVVLFGVGLNLQPVGALPAAAAQVPATDVASIWRAERGENAGPPPDRPTLLAALRRAAAWACAAAAQAGPAGGFAAYTAAFDALHVLHGAEVAGMATGGAQVAGRVVGTAPCGGLRLRAADGDAHLLQAGAVQQLRPRR